MRNKMTVTWLGLSLVGLLGLAWSPLPAGAHCEIPCGIYGDRMRVDMLTEHFQTIEKSMLQIQALSRKTDRDVTEDNQLVRWVTNKETHANHVQEIVYQYFMNQRVKPVPESDEAAHARYVQQVTLLHQMLVASMKCKQTVDVAQVETLRSLLQAFEKAYFTETAAAHTH